MRTSDHTFSKRDHSDWEAHVQSFLKSRRARAAVLCGGYCWRIALEHAGTSEAVKGPSGIYNKSEYSYHAWDVRGEEYVDDELTQDELDILCGVYISFTGACLNTMKRSWFPFTTTYEVSGENTELWTPRVEALYRKRVSSILNSNIDTNLAIPVTATKWRDKMRGNADARRATTRVESWSRTFLEENLVR